ncbi:MAG: hypothetical protein M0Z82_12275 [Actinomycetota bacterium]|nr:hypothetical protein [Actinomycetota bacterium]
MSTTEGKHRPGGHREIVPVGDRGTRPARGYSWPPFEEGNLVSVTHGAGSERVVAERAKRVHAEILEVAPWLSEAHFAPAVARYLAAAAREALLDQHIRQVAEEKGAGAVPSRQWEQVTAAARLAARLGSDLGLDPIGHARLKAVASTAELSVRTLAELSAEGRQLRERAEARLATALEQEDDSV